jgi:hypothetical protein
MDLAAVFLLSLLGGYYFSYLWRLTGYAIRRSEGHHLYFHAALFGIIFFIVAFILRMFLISISPSYEAIDCALVDYVRPILKEEPGVLEFEQVRRAQWVLTAFYSLVLGIACAGLFNIFTPERWALYRSVSALEKLLMQAQRDDRPVSLTLNTGKVYIGMVLATPDPGLSPRVVTLLPMLSGHRDDQERLVLTTDYETIYKRRKDGMLQFKLTIPAEMIVTASLFNPAIYAEFNPTWKQDIKQNRIA